MKNANSFFPSFWVKAIPVLLLLACIGFTNANAQNYKPLNEAVSSVQTALDNLKSQKVVGNNLNQSTAGAQKTNGMTPTQAANANVKVFEGSYFQRFLELAKTNQDVAAGVQALDAEFSTTGQALAARNATVLTSRNELMHLITY
jgi:hypothetical protein